MEESLVIGGILYTLVKEQRSGVSVYRNADAYLRLGDPTRIGEHIRAHEKMKRAGYPVAPLISRGLYKNAAYFIERSLGEKTFRTIFEEDIHAHGAISDKHFDQFLNIVKRYLDAQANTRVLENKETFAHGVHLDLIRTELPQCEISIADAFERALENLAGFPFVLSHGDFNPANLYPAGVIDLEDVFPAPFGFDAISAVSTIEWFPQSTDYEYFAHYRFTPAQKEIYLAMCDRVAREKGLPSISARYSDFAFCRAIWSTVRMHQWPKLQAWRYEKFIDMYVR